MTDRFIHFLSDKRHAVSLDEWQNAQRIIALRSGKTAQEDLHRLAVEDVVDQGIRCTGTRLALAVPAFDSVCP